MYMSLQFQRVTLTEEKKNKKTEAGTGEIR